jgi:predicted ATP-dependent endonuclease of OLD family
MLKLALLSSLVKFHKKKNSEVVIGKKSTDVIKRKVIGIPITEEMLAEEKDILAILNLQRSAQLFFSDKVILVEGEADRHLHRAAFQKLFDTTLELEDIALIEIGGKDRLHRFKAILTNVCPKVYAIADVDYIWEGAGNELDADVDLSQLVQQCRNKAEEELAREESMAGLNSDVRAEKLKELMKKCCFTTESCDKRNAVCGKLEALGTLVLRRGDIEAYVGLGKASKGKYLNAAREIESGERNLNFEDELCSIYTKIKR